MISNLPKYITFSFLFLGTACTSDEKIIEDACEVVGTCEELTAEDIASCAEDSELDPDGSCYSEERSFISCISTLSCDQYDAYINETEENYPCKSEEEAYMNCE